MYSVCQATMFHSLTSHLTRTQARAQILGVQDWRDNAAVVFTIITVIFLPLSFVASVFGINTSDVRDMALTQWVFWASAIVFTIIVVLITVYFVDVPPLWRWLERKSGEKVPNEMPPQLDKRSRSNFFAGVARQSGGMAAVHSAVVLDTQQSQATKVGHSMSGSAEESSTTSGDEVMIQLGP